MAAQSVVLHSYENPVETYSTNVLGTVNTLDAIRRMGRPCVVVNVTTDKCYENKGWVWGYRETDTLGGRDPYSNSKACAELVAKSFRESFFPPSRLDEHGVALASARAGNVIGGGDWTPRQLIPETIAAFMKDQSVVLRHPQAVRPWQHVLDCLGGYVTLAEALAVTRQVFRVIGTLVPPIWILVLCLMLSSRWQPIGAFNGLGYKTKPVTPPKRCSSGWTSIRLQTFSGGAVV